MKHHESIFIKDPVFKNIIVPGHLKIYIERHRPNIVELECLPVFIYPRVGTGHSKARISNRIY